ncbi:hypothetical protein MSG28_009416 [Choristoneura fumiferana]|uniref:Uncharacterized protein n=1 Tax=Choristoneura fumiferana TaxID=7141 RepID=A0ACC0KYD9_CHOFU|nr:hypothetical protein MSG28_009416 [Choristoneura fumiferana]
MSGARCMVEARGGWGSLSSCAGVCPKLRIWSSTAARVTGSVIWSRRTPPSLHKSIGSTGGAVDQHIGGLLPGLLGSAAAPVRS